MTRELVASGPRRSRSDVERSGTAAGASSAVNGGDGAGGWRFRRAFISAMPIRDLIHALDPAAARRRWSRPRRDLRYRDLPDGRADRQPRRLSRQLDLHPLARASRWAASRTSRTGAPRWCRTPDGRALGLEYFCFEGDELWTMADDRARRARNPRNRAIGLADPNEVETARSCA